jgi:hypothetical protein
MKALMRMLNSFGLLADVYVSPRRYTPLNKRGTHRDAMNLTSDYRRVGGDVRSALASKDVESAYRDSASF